MSIRVLDPTFSEAPDTANSMPRLRSLAGCTVGLLDNSKINVQGLLDHVEELLRSRYGVIRVVRLKKPDASRPAPPAVMAAMQGCEAIISAIGD